MGSITKHFSDLKYLKKIYKSLYFTPSVVLIAMLLITYWSWNASTVTLRRDTDAAVTESTSAIQNQIVQRLTSYEQILTGGAGLIRGSQEVLQSEWHDYVSTFNIKANFVGLQSVGYIKTFTAEQLPNVAASMAAQGIDFRLQPDTPRNFYTAIMYSDPYTGVNSSGIDMFSDATRRRAMERARDTGMTTLTAPGPPLLPVTKQLVLVMFVPQYQNNAPLNTSTERQAALRGYVYAGIRTHDFFETYFKVGGEQKNMAVQVSAYDADGQWVSMYKTNDFEVIQHQKGIIARAETLDVFGQNWKLDYSFKADGLVRAQRRNTPAWTALIGTVISILLAEVVFLLLKARSKELSHMKEVAVDLAKDELLSLASHQLRTPATTVKQYLGMVLQGFTGDLTPTQSNLLQKAYDGNERQLYIINEMLHVAKIDSGRIVLARHNTNLNQLLEDITQEAKNESEAHNHKISLNLPKRPVVLEVDEHMLRMAIENIVSNAIKYTLPGGRIKIKLQKRHQEIIIEVKDSGIGIDPKDMERLYKLFTRLDDPLTKNVSGTGVGLYLAKHLVELHGGSLIATSIPKRGSTFTIRLPGSN